MIPANLIADLYGAFPPDRFYTGFGRLLLPEYAYDDQPQNIST